MHFSKEFLISRGLVFNGRHLPYNKDLIPRAKHLRKNMTLEERLLWFQYLKDHELKILAQHPIDHFIVDFYCPEKKVVIEVDGFQHYTNSGIEYDEKRDEILHWYGVRVIRIPNNKIREEFEVVCKYIEEIFCSK